MDSPKSLQLFLRAKKVMVGGVNSPVRSFSAVGGYPRFIARAKGAYIWDADGRRYIDMVGSWGAIILGHAHPVINSAAQAAIKLGSSYGACHEKEIELAELLAEAFPKTIQQVRLTNSGTEAVMTALRLARGATGRELVVKFSGGYHGHHDSLLVSAGSGALTLGRPASAGVPQSWAHSTLVLPYNDTHSIRQVFQSMGAKIAAAIVEPVACNMGVVKPNQGFLEELRLATRRNGSLLIVDEVITGFRLRWGGLSDDFGADLVCLGKIIGGGFPIGAIAGPRRFMKYLSPMGPVYHAGTLAGNPVAVSAGIAALKELRRSKPYDRLESGAMSVTEPIRRAALERGIPCSVGRQGSLFTIFFTDPAPRDDREVQKTDTGLFRKFFWKMMDQGVYWPPSSFEACFLSAAHGPKDLKHISDAAVRAI